MVSARLSSSGSGAGASGGRSRATSQTIAASTMVPAPISPRVSRQPMTALAQANGVADSNSPAPLTATAIELAVARRSRGTQRDSMTIRPI